MQEVEIDGRRYIDVEESSCFCRQYRFSLEYVGPVSEAEELDLMDCNKSVGHPPDSYLELSQWYEEVRTWASKKPGSNR